MRVVLRVVSGLVTALLIMIIGTSAFLAFSARKAGDKLPSIFGHKVMAVISGSMEPAIGVGDVIIVRPLGPQDVVNEGDVITFRSAEKADMLITHRVVGTISVNGKPAAYVTKGDANQSEDLSTVAPQQIVGTYRYRVPYFGYVADFMRKPAGIIGLVIVPGLILIGAEFVKIWRLMQEADESKAASGGEKAD